MKKSVHVNLIEFTSIFEAWIIENGQALYRFIFKQIRHKELSEDIYQEVLLSAFVAFPSFEERAQLKSWIYRIAINKCKDQWRRDKTSQKYLDEQVRGFSTEDGMLQPEDTIVKKCSQEEILEKINILPAIYREPLYLFYYREQSLIEISTAKNVPISTIKTRMRRAKFQLKEKVELLEVR